jgi:lysophospholipid acyltransferase (LPLAT)-like uncharacterized protein
MKVMNPLIGWLLAGLVLLWRLTCRYAVVNDPRPALRQAGKPYAYALLHAHQVAAVLLNDEPRMAAMVSRSADGDLLVPSLRVRRVQPVRGSSRRDDRDKGGRAALAELIGRTQAGIPALLAVDGPRGPRNMVHRGVVHLALAASAVVLPVVVLPSQRWILRRTWDRLQVPRPFSHIRLIFGAPVVPEPGEDDAAMRDRLAQALRQLEAEHDPAEANASIIPAQNVA